MKIRYHKNFQKSFYKLDPKLKNKVIQKIQLFQDDVFHPLLKNHSLKGDMLGKRAFSVTGDVRIIFEEQDDYALVLFLDLGGHTQVYGF